MKIMQIYSNLESFKTVKFNENFNVILGDIKYGDDNDKDSHNLGKSTLIGLIDFLFLKNVDKNHFFKKPHFKSHIFFMEIKLNNGGYLTIKRPVTNQTKISFKLHETPYMNYVDAFSWDYLDLRLNAKNNEENPIYILNRYLDFDVLEDMSYRKSISYFFRTQDDYSDVFKLNKFRGSDLDWKPILFELLGFESSNMIDKYNLDAEKTKKEELICKIEDEFDISDNSTDKIKGLITIKSQEKQKTLQWLDGFDFYLADNKIEKEYILKIESNIATLNTEKYDLDYEINEINKSLKTNISYDIDDIKELYEEVKIYFPKQLINEYKDLIDFNNRVFNERKQYLIESLKQKKELLEKIEKQLIDLNQIRKEKMSIFTQTDTFEKYDKYRSELIDIEKELTKYETELENIDVIKSLRKELIEVENSINDVKLKLNDQIELGNDIYYNIRNDFQTFVKHIINKESNIWLEINSAGNINYEVAILDSNNEMTAEDDGHTYKKILCACFDLALIKNYMHKSFYKTVYHDGSLESLDPRKRKQYLDLVRKISCEYGIQYILTALKSEFPVDENEKYLPKEYEIAVELSDEDGDLGRLFGFAF